MSHAEDRENLVLAGRYRLVRLEDFGAAPEAWRAEALSGGAFTVFYYPDAALSGVGAQRFLRDVPFLRGIEHPKLVALLDAGVDPVGAVYGVCTACAGETLASRLERRGPLHYDDALRVVCDALEALGALHERNIVHQGITSADVLVIHEPDGRPRGRLLLGGALGVIARGAARGAGGDRSKAFGSPHHLAPEQCRGQAVTPETDVWAMGVVLHEALAGAPPFDGATPLEVIASVLAEEPPSISGRVPEQIISVLRDVLSKRAADRPPDAEAMCLMLSAARRSVPPGAELIDVPTEVVPMHIKTSGISRGHPAEFAADDLDGLIARVKSEHSPATDFSETFEGVTRQGPPRDVAEALAATDLPPPMADFDLDFDGPHAPPKAATPGDALPPPPVAKPAPSPEYIPELLSQAPEAQAAKGPERDSVVHTALSAETVDRTKSPRAPRVRTVNPYVAVLGVAGVTALLGYAGWQLSGADAPRGPAAPRHDEPRAPERDRAARSGDGGAEADGRDPIPAEPADTTRPENQTPVEFGEQIRIPIPTVPHDAVTQLIRHVTTAAFPDAATTPGFATCADQRLFVHPGGLVPTLRTATVDARCEAADLALIPDIDNDHAPDVIVASADNSQLVVVGSRALRVTQRIPLQGVVAVVAGLSHTERRRSEPVVVAYVAPRGGSAALVAVGVRTGSVYWRTPTAFTPAFARDYGLAVGPDADGDGGPDVVTGVLREGVRCVMVLSGADGTAKWPAPRCFDGASAQSLSLGADVNEDRRADVALGNSVEGRVRLLSGVDGSALRLIEPTGTGEGTAFGLGAILMPDVASDGFADVAVPRTEASGASVEVFSANDAHRLGRRDLGIRDAPAAALVRVQYLENFSFAGSRSLLVASPMGFSILGAAPRPEIRDQAATQ